MCCLQSSYSHFIVFSAVATDILERLYYNYEYVFKGCKIDYKSAVQVCISLKWCKVYCKIRWSMGRNAVHKKLTSLSFKFNAYSQFSISQCSSKTTDISK